VQVEACRAEADGTMPGRHASSPGAAAKWEGCWWKHNFFFALTLAERSLSDVTSTQALPSFISSAAKTARLRQAKEEAEREAAAYRAQRESEYQKKEVRG